MTELPESKDLFDSFDELPQNVKDIILSYSDCHDSMTYVQCKELVARLEEVGYTCQYYLDAIPYALAKIENSDSNHSPLNIKK